MCYFIEHRSPNDNQEISELFKCQGVFAKRERLLQRYIMLTTQIERRSIGL